MVRLTISAATLFLSFLFPACGHTWAAGNGSLPSGSAASVSSEGASGNKNAHQKLKDARLQGQFAIIRYVDGEFARAIQPLPSRKKGFHYTAGEKIDPNKLRSALAYGSAANPGDQVQITNIEFQSKAVVVSINGGTKGHFDWKKHIQISMGGAVPVSTTPANQGARRIGAELVLDFPGHVPDLTPDQLKQYLSPFLDFSNQHSAAVNWIDTLPPEFQQAIKAHQAIVGMNQDMVMAAMGRPDKKVREQDESGQETEDWIYGLPPDKSTLVTFQGNKVIRVKSYG